MTKGYKRLPDVSIKKQTVDNPNAFRHDQKMKRYNKQHIIKELESAIAEAGSLRRFAARADISAAYLSQVKAGTVPPSARLAQALGYDVDGLIYVRRNHPHG